MSSRYTTEELLNILANPFSHTDDEVEMAKDLLASRDALGEDEDPKAPETPGGY